FDGDCNATANWRIRLSLLLEGGHRDQRLSTARRSPGKRRGSWRCQRRARRRGQDQDGPWTLEDQREQNFAEPISSETRAPRRYLVPSSGRQDHGYRCLWYSPCRRAKLASLARWLFGRSRRLALRLPALTARALLEPGYPVAVPSQLQRPVRAPSCCRLRTRDCPPPTIL